MSRIGLATFCVGIAIISTALIGMDREAARSYCVFIVFIATVGFISLAGSLVSMIAEDQLLSIQQDRQERLRRAFAAGLTEKQLRLHAAAESCCSCGLELSKPVARKLRLDHADIERGRRELADLADRLQIAS